MRALLGFLVLEGLTAAFLFGPAGRLDLPWFWAYLATHAALLGAALLAMDPSLRKERLAPAPGGQDRKLRLWMTPFLLACLVVAGLDAGRFGWTGELPWWVHAAGLALVAAGTGLVIWSMVVNRFFSPVVRIQQERGHHLITSGPYRFVRHPGYAGLFLSIPGLPLALGSLWALLPMIPVAALVLRRTLMEDRFLTRELEGYADYAARVRSRLVPGVW
jgi:protein-S-isoprenylcysteine O-methyltransferase Ste14